MPNGLFTFREYLNDFASPATREKGLKLMETLIKQIQNENLQKTVQENVQKIDKGERDIYL